MTQLRKVQIAGTGSFAPEGVITNADLEKLVDTSDEWIFTRTGIRERRKAADGVATSDISMPAARQALDAAGVAAKDLDLILVGTVTPDTMLPSTACRLQKMLDAPHAGAVDMVAACSGFLYVLATGWQFIQTGMYDNVLVVGAECLTKIVDYQDRGSCIIFGDGAGAAVLTPSTEDSEILYAELGAMGDEEIMDMPGGGSLHPASHETVDQRMHFIRIEGRRVYKFAVNKMVELVRSAAEKNGYAVSDIDYVIPHQVNMRIIESSMERLGLPLEKAYTNIEKYGNTSAGSVPMALDEAVREGKIKRGDLVVFVAFGAGLTWGSTLVRW